jgi:hypothetical protein
MIAILWTARNGPNPVPQDARTRSPCSSRGRRRNGNAVPRWSALERMFSDSLPQAGCSTRAARRRGHEGLLSDRYRADGERCRARPRDANFDVLGFCERNSSERLGAAIFNSRVDPLGTQYEPRLFASVRYRPVTAVVLWRAGEDWEPAVDRKHLALALLPARSNDWP